jgi:hypothetical protein
VVSTNGRYIVVPDSTVNQWLLIDSQTAQTKSIATTTNMYAAGVYDDGSTILFANRGGLGCMLVRVATGTASGTLPCGPVVRGRSTSTGFRYLESRLLYSDNFYTEHDSTGAELRPVSIPGGAPTWGFLNSLGGVGVTNGINGLLLTENSALMIPPVAATDSSNGLPLSMAVKDAPIASHDGRTVLFSSGKTLWKWVR